MTLPVPLLILSGTPGVWRQGPLEPLHLRYRKGLGVLGFLAAHSGRLVARSTLADLLWPVLDRKGARSNLRVVLSDLLVAFRALGLQDALEFQRDWLMLNTSLMWSEPSALHALAAVQTVETLQSPMAALLAETSAEWLTGAEEGASSEYCEWLGLQRQSLERLRLRVRGSLGYTLSVDESSEFDTFSPLDAGHSRPAALWSSHVDSAASVKATATAAPQMALLALLRVELVRPAESVDLAAEDSPMADLLATIKAEASIFGGEVVASDPMGCVVAFGLGSLHTGYRWQAFRAAIHVWTLAGARYPLSMGLTVGRVLVQYTAAGVKLQGWRLSLLNRLAMRADPGQLVCCESLIDIAVPFGFEPAGPHRFRGFEREFSLYQHDLASSSPLPLPAHGGDYTSLFIPPPGVLEEAQALLTQACRGPSTALVLGGDNGLGKTRVAWEFAQRQHAQGGRVLWIGARPEAQRVAWGCLYDALVALVPGAEALDVRLNRLLAQLELTLDAPARASLVGLLTHQNLPLEARGDLVRALTALLKAPAGRACVCIIDDAQWLDRSTVDVLERTAGTVNAVFWLQTLRSGHSNPLRLEPVLAGIPGSVASTCTLMPMDDASALALVAAMPESAAISESVQRGRIANARGVPLYLLADMAAENSNSSDSGHFGEFCNAMLNRMGAGRTVLQMAAVRGMLFTIADLDALCGVDLTAQSLARAEALGLVVSRGMGMWAFFHPRLRECMFDTLSLQARQDMAGQWAQRLQERSEFSAAAALWELTKAPETARTCWHQAARSAMAAGDLLAASSAFDNLATLGYTPGLTGLDQRASHITTTCGVYGYGSRRALDLAEQALAEMADLQEHPEAAFRLLALGYLVSVSQGHRLALPYALRMKVMAQTPEQHFYATALGGISHLVLGNLAAARAHFEQTALQGSLLEPHQRRLYFPSDIQVFVLVQQAWAQWLMGDVAAGPVMSRAREHAYATQSGQDRCIFHAYQAMLYWAQGRYAEQAEHAAQALHIANDEGLALWQAVAGLQHLQAVARLTGQTDAVAIGRFIQSIRMTDRNYETPARLFGVCALNAGQQHLAALALADETLAGMTPGEHLDCLMDLWRLKAQSHAALGQQQLAQTAFAAAEKLARDGKALGWLNQWQGRLHFA